MGTSLAMPELCKSHERPRLGITAADREWAALPVPVPVVTTRVGHTSRYPLSVVAFRD